jgi:DNA topoisomerase VI subunit B
MEKLNRETFKQNRSLEFFSEKELSMQIGHSRRFWPIAVVKELIDNSLDACETAGILPEIHITADDECLTIQDNGPGIAEKTIEQSLDYMVRISDKNFYTSPSRGQLGNALKCLYAVPFVMTDDTGRVGIETSGKTHHIEISVDQIAQEPVLKHTVETSSVKNGTFVKICLTGIACYLEEIERGFSYQSGINGMLLGYSAVNPHASFFYHGEAFSIDLPRITTTCSKWTPSNPTSAHWYNVDRLSSLIGAYLANERGNGQQRTVRDFVAEFKWLSSTQKRKVVTDQAGLTGSHLKDLIENGALDHGRISALLDAMQENSKPVKPKGLGMIGECHLKQWMHANFKTGDSFKYRRIMGDPGGLPFILEAAFGVMGGDMAESYAIKTNALNWTPTLITPFQYFGYYADKFISMVDPVHLFVHLSCPRMDFTDRGKTRLNLHPDIEDALEAAIKCVTKEWEALKTKEIRQRRQLDKERAEMQKAKKRRKLSIKNAAFKVMEQAYMKASNDNALPANARQIMYAARPGVLELTGGKCWKNDSYFTQTLLPDFQEQNPELTSEWDVVYDARGSLIEPHTGEKVEIGTLGVRRYVNSWHSSIIGFVNSSVSAGIRTSGPEGRYKYALFIEKEGFNELFKSVKLAERYDMAIMSNKGMSVTAGRELAAKMSSKDVTIFVLRDFDKSGFSIAHTLRTNTRRWSFETPPNIIDLGFRLEDVEGLETEDESYGSNVDPRVNLIESGATEEEAAFLRSGGRPKQWEGKRVELNAMTSRQLIDWLENKLQDHGVRKVVPDEDVLQEAYVNAFKAAKIREEVNNIVSQFDEEIQVPDDLRSTIEKSIHGTARSWDSAIKSLAQTI